MKGILSALLLLAVLLVVTAATTTAHAEPPVDVKSLLQEIEKAKETMTEAGQTVEKTFSVQEVAELVKELQQDRSSFFKRHPSTPLDHLINAFKPFLHDPAGSKALPELFPEIRFQWVRTRDWIFLSTITINPRPHDERKPAVLVRTPYGPTTSNLADLYLLDGYVAVLQDQRGAFLSTGDWDFWREDSQDAYDTMEWIAQQKWSNGKVFTAGISADGCSALTQALFNPPWLVGQFIVWASGEAHDTAYQGGAYRQSLLDGWLTAIGVTTRLHSLTVIGDVKEHEAKDSYWNTLSLVDNNAYANITFPAVFWVGWYDIFAFENIEAFNGYRSLTDPSVRGKHVLYVDPGGHCVGSGKASFPDSFTLLPLKLSRDLFKSVISGQPPSNQYSMHIYVMGTALKNQQQSGDYGNYWTSLQDWPKRTPTPYYLQIGGKLSTDKPSTVGTAASYLYDPRNPWPSLGGTNLAPPCGVQDQSENEAREDVLVFTSDYLSGPVAIVGPIQVTLYVSSNAVDTDFTAFLTDVTPDNSSSLVQDGIRRMRWRNSKVTPSWMQQGEIYEITINLGNTAQVFNKGHRIRVSVSSSNSPRFQVNRNNGKLVKDEGTYVEAINTVHYSANHQSHILLPVVNLADIPENEEIKRLYAVKLDE